MAPGAHGPLLILPTGLSPAGISVARVVCAHCGGGIVLDMRSRAAVEIVERLADVHECPDDADVNALLRLLDVPLPLDWPAQP